MEIEKARATDSRQICRIAIVAVPLSPTTKVKDRLKTSCKNVDNSDSFFSRQYAAGNNEINIRNKM